MSLTTWTGVMKTRFVVCIDNSEYPASLELHKIYQVLSNQDGERNGDLPILNETVEEHLYRAGIFSR